MNHPLVSIIIPVYNGSEYMRDAIDSALSQTYDNIEILLINDGSSDGGKTEEIALSYGNKIRYFYKENGGVSTALNLGIKNMKGEYFSWLSHDDSYEPKKIEEQVLSLQGKNKFVSVCSTKTIDKDSNLVSVMKKRYKSPILSSEEALIYVTKYGINGCSFLIPKKAFEEVGFFNEELRYCQDTFMWWNIFLAGYSLLFIDYIGVSYRVHPTQVTQTNKALYVHDSELISDIIIPEFLKVRKKDNNVFYTYALDSAKQGTFNILQKCIDESKKCDFFTKKQLLTLWFMKQYGKIRPLIRKLYYRTRLNMKTR